MPGPFRTRTCEVCGVQWQTRKPGARTCSPLCRAALREAEHPSKGAPARTYPKGVIEGICGMYRAGMTHTEIGAAIRPGAVKVQLVLARYLPQEDKRPRAKRHQAGSSNHMWKADDCGYQAAHLRLGRAADHRCVDCGEQARNWSYVHGCPDERRDDNHPSPYCTHPDHYEPRCVTCHRAYDRIGGGVDV